ncbi:MAG: prolyl oligopeptidase family serine peptidase [Acidimicrobiia bacterium]|nr:prolyl oligopeptidase family serine peptidase [Acidimicrobiia bacterium]
MSDSFPRQHARTQRFSLGEPRTLRVSPDGHRIVFLRSAAGDDPITALWVADVATGEERCVADPRSLLGDADHADLPEHERRRRERARESAGGITGYATDDAVTVASFTLGGRLFAAGLISGRARPLDVTGPVFDPRPDPLARRIAYVSGSGLRLAELDGSSRLLIGPDQGDGGLGGDGPADVADDSVSWGSADFIAAEEMHRFRGYWWSPDGEALAVCRVDTTPVERWTIADPGDPATDASIVRYPAAGTPNPAVTLHLVDLTGSRREVSWDASAFPYLAVVDWSPAGLIAQVQSRDQRRTQVLRVDTGTGATSVVATDDDSAWVELVPGTPCLTDDGRLVGAADRDGVRRLLIDGEPVTPNSLQVRSVVSVGDSSVTFRANPIDDASSMHVWRRDAEGSLTALSDGPGIHTAAVGGACTVLRTARLDRPGLATTVSDRNDGTRFSLSSHAEVPLVQPNVEIFTDGERNIATAVLLPHGHDGSPLPVLLDPYGGPHALRVQRSYNAFCASQWFADQGFAVVVADGRGTPGRGSAWERAVHGDLASAPLDDQIVALETAARHCDSLDLDRVAIRGWSFGGYLAALAVLRRPDVFHAAVAGAPVTDWRLYDTHYTERYLGMPAQEADAYDASSLIADAASLIRPLLLIHGLADDNVVAAHTLRLSSALLAAGRPHEVLPLVGVTHMTSQEVVAENLLLHQLDFLRRSLDPATPEHPRASTLPG